MGVGHNQNWRRTGNNFSVSIFLGLYCSFHDVFGGEELFTVCEHTSLPVSYWIVRAPMGSKPALTEP